MALGLVAFGSIVWLGIAVSALVSRQLLRARRAEPSSVVRPDVSLVCPLWGASDALAENLRTRAEVAYDGELEIVCVAADANDPAWAVLDAVESHDVVRRARRLVAGAPPPEWLPKTWSLSRAVAVARHEQLVFVDADVRLDASVLADVVAASVRGAAAYAHPVVTAPRGAGGWLEAAVVNYTTLVVQPMLARLGIDHLAGTLWATSRTNLQRIGGFDGVRDSMADDVSLGRRWRAMGGRLVFVARPVVTAQGTMRLGDFVRHQIRWLRTWRRVAGCTWPLALVFSAVVPAFVGATLGAPWVAVAGLALAEAGLLFWIEPSVNGTSRIPGLALVAPIALAAEQVIAVAALCGRTVVWGGYRFALGRGGRIVGRTPVD